MLRNFSIQEIIIIFTSVPIITLLLIAMLNQDWLNNLILKTKGTNHLDSWIANKEAWKAGLKVFWVLLAYSILAISFIYTRDNITPTKHYLNFFRWAFILIQLVIAVIILIRVVKYFSK
jgi:hypothetical protein